jgi:hypothetical protein
MIFRPAYLITIMLLVGILSAGSINPAGMRAVKTVTTEKIPANDFHAAPVTVAAAVTMVYNYGIVNLSSVPSGVDVYLMNSMDMSFGANGTFQGRTPIQLTLIPVTQAVRLRYLGYDDKVVQVTVQPGQVQDITVRLDKFGASYSAAMTKTTDGPITAGGAIATSPTIFTDPRPPPLKIERSMVVALPDALLVNQTLLRQGNISSVMTITPSGVPVPQTRGFVDSIVAFFSGIFGPK